jgi:hypothetical protein
MLRDLVVGETVVGSVEDVPLIDGRRWFAWDGEGFYGLAATAVEPSNWPERLGSALAVHAAARPVMTLAGATRTAIVSHPEPDDPGPVLIYLVEQTHELVLVTRAEHVAGLLALLGLPPVDEDRSA